MMFLCGMGVIETALLARFVLGHDEELTLLGIDHEGWETIHFTLGCIWVGLIAIHIGMHWGVIQSAFRRLVPNRTVRVIVGVIFIIVCILLVTFPFIVKPKAHGASL